MSCLKTLWWALKSWLGIVQKRARTVRVDSSNLTPTGVIELVGTYCRQRGVCFSRASLNSDDAQGENP